MFPDIQNTVIVVKNSGSISMWNSTLRLGLMLWGFAMTVTDVLVMAKRKPKTALYVARFILCAEQYWIAIMHVGAFLAKILQARSCLSLTSLLLHSDTLKYLFSGLSYIFQYARV